MRAAYAAPLAALAACGSCIYTTESALPAHIRTVRVAAFENRSGYPGLEAELAQQLVREFQADGVLVPVSRNADAVLRGTVTAVTRSVLQEDAYDDVVTGRVSIAATVSLEDIASGKKLLADARVTSLEAQGDEGIFRLRRGETETAARGSAVAELARNIVRRVTEAW